MRFVCQLLFVLVSDALLRRNALDPKALSDKNWQIMRRPRASAIELSEFA
jgi:hypothetical protein